jgi:hypothetical protein
MLNPSPSAAVGTAATTRPSTLDRALLFGLVAALLLLALKCAWACDDAYITFRVVDNFTSGLGLRWNATERVQAYTNPLWMLLMSLPYMVTREPYFTSLALSLACTAAAALLLAFRGARDVAGPRWRWSCCAARGLRRFFDLGAREPAAAPRASRLRRVHLRRPDRRRSLKSSPCAPAPSRSRASTDSRCSLPCS